MQQQFYDIYFNARWLYVWLYVYACILPLYIHEIGATENAGLENAAPSKMQGWKMQDWKMQHQSAGAENAGLENAAPESRGGKCRTGKCETEMQGWKMRDQAGMESQTSHCVTYIPHCHVYVAVFLFGFQRCLYATG